MLLTWGHYKVQNGAKQVHCRAHLEEVFKNKNPRIDVLQMGEWFSKIRIRE